VPSLDLALSLGPLGDCEQSPASYERRMQDTEIALLESSETARKLMSENYTGLPY
jgi:hypothetical protein